MSIPFAQTLQALDADRRGGHLWALLAGASLLGAWLAWAVLAEVPVLATSTDAGVEPERPPIALVVPADGLVVAAPPLALGQRVRAGQTLLVLDAGDLRDRLAALRARRDAVAAEMSALADQEGAAHRAFDESDRGRAAADGELAAAARQAGSAAALAEQATARGQRLAAAGLLAAAEAARGQAEAEQRRAAAEAAALAFAARSHQGRAALADRRASLDRLAAERAALRGEIAVIDGDAAALAGEIARRTLRAPGAGRLAGFATVAPGSRALRGAHLGTLIAEGGPLHVRARFPPAAGAALRPGQRAWVHLPAGLTSPAAVLPATVASVATVGNVSNGGWEATLSLSLPAGAKPPASLLRPGEPCRVEVEVARLTPAVLLLGALHRDGAS
jgi:multidrug resistance efflux pump